MKFTLGAMLENKGKRVNSLPIKTNRGVPGGCGIPKI
jgi:hypothetical protein